jgi:hypothetical protein
VKRVFVWSAPVVVLGTVIGLAGYRVLAHRRARHAGTEGVAVIELANGRRIPAGSARLHLPVGFKTHGIPRPPAPSAMPTTPLAQSGSGLLETRKPASTAPVLKPEEQVVYKKLEPLVAGRKDTDLRFVVCEPFVAPQAGQDGNDEGQNQEQSAFDIPPKDPKQPVCRARVMARDHDTLVQVVREASKVYGGHVAIEVKEEMTAYTGVYFTADMRVDTDDAQPLPSDI